MDTLETLQKIVKGLASYAKLTGQTITEQELILVIKLVIEDARRAIENHKESR